MAVKKAAAADNHSRVVREAMTKSAMVTAIAEETGLTKNSVSAVLGSLSNIIHGHLRKGGVGTFTFLNLIKIKVERIPATEARIGRNPFTGKVTVFDAIPAHAVVNLKPLKALEDMT